MLKCKKDDSLITNQCCLFNEFAGGNERAPFTHPASLCSLALSSASGKEGEKCYS